MPQDAKVKALSQVPLFEGCSSRELGFIASRTDEVPVGAGRVLTKQGRPGNSFYVILDGEAEVEIDGAKRGILKKGDFFGEISMLDRGNATATVTTTKPSRLMVMSHSQFRDAVNTRSKTSARSPSAAIRSPECWRPPAGSDSRRGEPIREAALRC
ncbi:MAG: cyclic nucleotide-binding domain-containing protein [Chloroflexi bacterium]|nr:MAG: cyclic nucleotide-binding domain-containing protein [Chloroflexota bacterium]